jgi:hypothetical protein
VAGSAAQFGDGGADGGLGQHAEPEGQGGGRDVELALDRQPYRDRVEVGVGELAVRLATAGWPVAQRRQQAEVLPVAEHPGGHAEPGGSFSDPHNQ